MSQNDSYSTQYQLDSQMALNAYLTKVFATMFGGLFVTAVTAYYFASTRLVENLGYAVFAIIIAQFALVIAISAAVNKLSYAAALSMFIGYSFLNGITMSFIFLVYEIGTISLAFSVSAVTFGVMAAYGYVTKSDLTSFGSLARMLLIGGLITMVVNIFIGSPQIDYFISIVLLFVFVGLVACDTQKLKAYFYNAQNDVELQRKLGVHGALSLYLDFINIFLLLLRIFGRGRR